MLILMAEFLVWKLTFPSVNEEGIGYLFAFFEVACAVSGLMMEVNPFDQPGVEAYKKNLFALMGRPGYEELQETLKNASKIQTHCDR